jgi:hypothetical protein
MSKLAWIAFLRIRSGRRFEEKELKASLTTEVAKLREA